MKVCYRENYTSVCP